MEKLRKISIFLKHEKEKGKQVKVGYNEVILSGEEWRWRQKKRENRKVNTKNQKMM